MLSLHPRRCRGVIFFSKKEHNLVPDSVRISTSPGHYVVGVYELGTNRVIIAGVYGCSEWGDCPSLVIIDELREKAQELSQIFQTHEILMAGDFNATLHEADSNNCEINKPNSVRFLHAMIEDHQLVDLVAVAGCVDHTWHRKDSSGHSSCNELILTNIPM
jgi:hypothetical protein